MKLSQIFVFLFKLPLFVILTTAEQDEGGVDADDSGSGQPDITKFVHLRKAARYGGHCDVSLNDKFVLPVLHAKTSEELWAARGSLNEYLSQNPDLESKSCYGLVEDGSYYDDTYMSCQSCQDPRHRWKKVDCCRCHNREPQVYERQLGRPNPCKIKDSEFGDPCSYEVMKDVNEKTYHPFFRSLQSAKKNKDYISALQAFVISFSEFFEVPGHSRLTCHSLFNNLECKPSNTCGCRQDPPYFDYVLAPDGKRCIAKKGSVCHIEAAVYQSGVLEYMAKCSHDAECVEAVPRLTCDPILEKDCLLAKEVWTPADSPESISQEVSNHLLKWNIRACGGFWNKTHEFSSGSPNYSTRMFVFIALTVTIMVVTLG